MPQILIQADLLARATANFPSGLLSNQRAHISGPQAGLHRYAVATEKVGIALGAYNPSIDVAYSYPVKAAGSVIDQNYVKLFVDSGKVLYFTDLIGSGNVIIPVSSYTDRIKVSSGTTVFKANGVSFPRSSDLKADVQVGDIVYIRGVISATNVELWTYVKDFIADVVAAVVSSAAADTNNKANQSATTSNSFTAGTVNCVLISAVDGTTYDGLSAGNISETYTVKVIQGSVSGNATTARLQVTSASGNDNVASVTPAAFASATAIGTRGLTVTWSNTLSACSGQDFVVGQTWSVSVSQAFTAPGAGTSGGTFSGGASDDTTYILEVTRGGKYTTAQAVANPGSTPALSTIGTGGSIAASTYFAVYTYLGGTSGETLPSTPQSTVVASGSTSTLTLATPPAVNGATQYHLYVGTVTGGPYFRQGGPYTIGSGATITSYTGSGTQPPVANTSLGQQPNLSPTQVTVTTSTGSDLSGPTSLTLSGSGVTFTANAFTVGTKGVTWTPGSANLCKGDKYRIPVTGQKAGAYKTLILGQSLPLTPLDLTTATDLDLKLYANANGVQVSINRVESPPNVNYVVSSTTFTTKAGITATDARWTDGSKFPLIDGQLYLEYREWVQDNVGKLLTTTNSTNVLALLGTVHPDNPLAWGVYKALQNSNSGAVAYTVVADPNDSSAWQTVLDLIDSQSSIYNLVPLTTTKAITDLFVTHVNAQSAAEIGANRVVWVPAIAKTARVVVDNTKSSDSGVVLATLKDDPDSTGTQYTLLNVPASNAKFVTNGVQVGDIVRYLYTTDGFGNTSWTEFAVAKVMNEDTLILSAANNVPINSAQKVEVWHTLTKTEVANDLVAQAAVYANRRVRCYWPDALVEGTNTFNGWGGAAACAGLISAVPPHQGIANTQLLGIDAVPRTVTFFTTAHRKTLAAGGVWVIDQDPATGYCYVRATTTTDISSGLNNREEMMVRNLDVILLVIMNQLSKYYGVANVVDSTFNQMTADIRSTRSYLIQSTFVSKLGSMITDLNITDIRQHATLLDRVVISLTVTLPAPVNKVVLQVVV